MRGHAFSCVLALTALITIPAASAKAASLAEPPDFSGNGAAPTHFNLTAGSNTLTGTMGGSDADIVHINIPAGLALAQIQLLSYSAFDLSFIGLQNGSTWTGNPNIDGNVAGYTHISPGQLGTDLLDDIAANSGGAVTPPLTGDRTFWLQNATTGNTSYSLNFVVIPEPAGIALLAVAGMTLVARPRRL